MCESDCFDEMTVDFQVNVGKGFTHQRGRPHTNLCAVPPPLSAPMNTMYIKICWQPFFAWDGSSFNFKMTEMNENQIDQDLSQP